MKTEEAINERNDIAAQESPDIEETVTVSLDRRRDVSGNPSCLSGKGVTKIFGSGNKQTVAVDHVDFDFREGELVSIVGESGSGKTTLSKMLLGLLPSTEGEIRFRGEIRDISSHHKKRAYWKNIRRSSRIPSPPSTCSIRSMSSFWTAST